MAAPVVGFTEAACSDIAVAGGKGANLAKMTEAGLRVPPGFCVTTDAYAAFVEAVGLEEAIAEAAAQAGSGPDAVEAATAALREKIEAAPLPEAIAESIAAAYGELGAETYVAVRSSGTAEDLADASFAGLHDTYLDVRGPDEVVDAVRRCWASMWTARATSYRETKGFDQGAARIAVVVQTMVPSEASGVMFTANPLTAATDEIVINATWGLGEALVSGIATPDEHILSLRDLAPRSKTLGAKEKRVVRDPDAGSGTITEDTPAAERERFALDDARLRELGDLGKRVMAHYGGIPQDIEWALAGGEIFVLQSRPATGAEFSWDEDLEFWQLHDDDGSVLWTRSWADEVWNGGISPFAYSYRGALFSESMEKNMALWGIPPLDEPAYRYHRGTAYYNTHVEQRVVEETALKPFRVGPLLNHVPPDKHEEIQAKPLSPLRYLTTLARITVLGKPVHGALRYFKTMDDYLENRTDEADGKTAAELERLTDEGLITYLEDFVKLKEKNTEDQWTEFFIFARDSVSLLAGALAMWHNPEPQLVLTDLMSGGPVRTTTAEENLWLWRLTEQIRSSPELHRLFDESGIDFLEAFEGNEDGRAFLTEYGRFMAAHAHRGHADRDPYYPRRADDPSIDHETFKTLLSVENPVDPEEREREVDARRQAVIAEVEANLHSQALGGVKVKVFKGLLDYAHRFFLYRDNQRANFDRYTYSMKRGVIEVGKRLTERGALESADDAYFLGRLELYELLRGEPATPLTAAKIAGRRANFLKMVDREARLPKYMRGNEPVAFETGDDDGAGGLSGAGTSRGQVTGRARVILSLKDIGQVQDGDILITNSTDPGWTPVFTLLSGIVLETGGMLAHGSLLAREYGFPAVQIDDATQLIPDGAEISVDGDTGQVVIADEVAAEEVAS